MLYILINIHGSRLRGKKKKKKKKKVNILNIKSCI